mmetsp:Transcript_6223/g.11438  ORF Transcript_6223/g.11438 Transcript_6223/m.11438 type:complete len:203 (-) Transcript_6223:168-776(-)
MASTNLQRRPSLIALDENMSEPAKTKRTAPAEYSEDPKPTKKQKTAGDDEEKREEKQSKALREGWELSTKRKVKLDRFKGQLLVNIREFYTKDGKELPGRKGIALTPQQWSKLYEHMAEIDEKATKEELVSFSLSAKRRAQVSKYKGMLMVGIREVYTKDGKELPGKKGISLTLDQWKKLVECSKSIDQAVTEAVKEEEEAS